MWSFFFFINAVHQCFIHVHLISIQDQNTEKLELAKGQMIYFLHSLGSLGFLDAGDFVSIRTKKQSTCATGWNFDGGTAMFQTLGRGMSQQRCKS